MTMRRAAIAASLLLSPAAAFYLPGSAPRDYHAGDLVPVLVNALTPQIGSKAQLRSVISYDYYNEAFHFCRPDHEPKQQPEALGSILSGDRLYDSPFQIRMLENRTCAKLCDAIIPAQDANFVNERIREDYALNWLVDGLPAAEMKLEQKTGEIFYSIGFELGDGDAVPTPALHNHYKIYIDYHARTPTDLRVVGVVVWPLSSATAPGQAPDCSGTRPIQLKEESDNHVTYTYSVIWRESATPWATRWDTYLHVFDPRIHWFSLINSIVVAGFLCAMVAMILARTVTKDLHRYNAVELTEEIQEDYGWRLLYADVFRSPQSPMFLAVTVGSGAQLAAMAGSTLVFALLGFLSPSNRGSLSTVMIVCWTLFGFVAGYVSSRLYVTVRGAAWKQNVLLTATAFPGLIFAVLFLLNLFLIGSGSSGALPFGTMLAVLALWFLISLPLNIAGAFLALRAGPLTPPRHVNQIPRQIPPAVWYLKPWPASLMAGILPFGAAFIELYFVLSSLFASKAYYAFGFLALTFLIVALTTATVTILMIYFTLCQEDHRWQWRSFHIGGGSAFWILLYGCLYWSTRLSLQGFSSKVLYVGYLCLIAATDYLVCGTIGYLATAAFMWRIYGALRVD